MENKKVLVFGATGNMGGAAARELLKRGWQVRGVTRNPESEPASALKKLGAEVFQADFEDRSSLEKAIEGFPRVFSVQNWVTAGVDGEIRQGKLVAEVAREMNVQHLVYGSAGTGQPNSGLPHFDAKIEVEAHMRNLGLSYTIIRPTPFMELLTEKEFFPSLATWGMEPRITGWDLPLPWVAIQDIGKAIATVFEDPDRWTGADIELFGDIKTLREAQAVFTLIDGKKPVRIPIPFWIFRKMAGDEFIDMWHWIVVFVEKNGKQGLMERYEKTKMLIPNPVDMETWLKQKRNGFSKN